jgi:hypothetical protein
MMDFHSTQVFSMKKSGSSMNFTVDGIASHRTHHKSLYRDEQTLDDQLHDGLQGSESCDTTSHMCALHSSYISCLK